MTLTVIDDDGATDSSSQQVEVVPYQPTIAGVNVEDQSADRKADYRVDYNVDNATEFDQVEVEFDNLDQDWADGVETNRSARGYVTYSTGGTEGDTYDITVRAYNLSGTVTDSVTITDLADGDDTGDGNLTTPDSPEFTGVVVDDTSTANATYEVSYNVINRSEFDHVEVEVENLDRSWASATYTSSDPRDNVDNYEESTYGDSYLVTASIYDSSGMVVDEVEVTDTADGTDP